MKKRAAEFIHADNDPHPRRPITVTTQGATGMIHDMILSVGWITQYFAAPLGISNWVVQDKFQMKKVSLCWVMKNNLSGDNLLQEVSEMEDTSERHLSESPAQKTAKSLISTGKVVATVFWEERIAVTIAKVPNGTATEENPKYLVWSCCPIKKPLQPVSQQW